MSTHRANEQPVNRRSKPQLSCHLCRKRKLRCNRQHPCSSCTSRGLAFSCTYSHHGPSPTEGIRKQDIDPRRSEASIKDRVVQLEQMVVSLMQRPTHEEPHSISVTTAPGRRHDDLQIQEDSPNCGSLTFNSSEPQYVSGTHWAALLDSIADLKDCLQRREDQSIKTARIPHVLLLYDCKLATKEEILEALPSRTVVDRLVSQYFNRLDLAPMCLHSGLFLKEYEKFWNAPYEAPIMWLGLLFAMICLASLASSTTASSYEDCNSVIDIYREKVVQCLILGEYTKPGHYNYETLYNYLVIEYSIRSDASRDIWVLMGILINLGMQMGYHRDPSHFSGVSPLVAEIRRRAWVTLLQGDIIMSTQMGMPRIIKECQYDTSEPRNLNDFDFDENTTELPESRPETEITTSSQMIARRRMFIALGKIVDFTTAAVHSHSYEDTLRLDSILHDAERALPAPFRTKSIGSAVTDPPQMIMHRLFLRLMFHKGQMMLHRKYLDIPPTRPSPDEESQSYEYSRKSCLEAVLGVLKIQRTLDEETTPNGQLHPLRWKLSSFMKHEFLTATMVLCHLLSQHGRDKLVGIPGCSISQEHIINALKGAHDIWDKFSHTSSEARIAANALRVVLEKNDVIVSSTQVNRESEDGDGIARDFDRDFVLSSALNIEQAEKSLDWGMPFLGPSLNLDDMLGDGFPFSSTWNTNVEQNRDTHSLNDENL